MLGIFDSGLGGLTVVREVLKRLPNRPIIYFGDTARVPYGNKSPELIKKYAREGVEFLLSRGAHIIILACNTMSAVAFDDLKNEYKIPFFEVITPAVKRAIEVTKNGRIGVIGTRATIKSNVYSKKIQNFHTWKYGSFVSKLKFEIKIFSQACPILVPLVEEGWTKKPETEKIVEEYLEPLLKEKIDTLILGCTHYPMLKKTIQKTVGPKIKLVDSAEEVAKEVILFLESAKLNFTKSKTGHRIYVSDKTEHLEKLIADWLKKDTKINIIKLPAQNI